LRGGKGVFMGHYYSEMVSDKTIGLQSEYWKLHKKVLNTPLNDLTVGDLKVCQEFLKKGYPGMWATERPSDWEKVEEILNRRSRIKDPE